LMLLIMTGMHLSFLIERTVSKNSQQRYELYKKEDLLRSPPTPTLSVMRKEF
jgi:hypothetical protein